MNPINTAKQECNARTPAEAHKQKPVSTNRSNNGDGDERDTLTSLIPATSGPSLLSVLPTNVDASPPRARVRTKALVSSCSGEMLTSKVMIGGKLETAHLDSCATHCYVSTDTSAQMTKRGYPPVISKILFDVEQGNPLCTTNTVHYLPVSMIREDGSVCHWDSCLFLVANAGAPIILCCPLLQQGGIIRYEPPPGYEDLLQQFNDIREIHSLQQHADNKNHRPASCDSFYGPPSTTNRRLAGLLLTDAAASKTGPGAVICSKEAITDTSTSSGTINNNPSTSTSTDSATDSASSTNTIVSTTDTTVDTSASNQHEITNETRITVETSLIANQKLNGPDALLRLTDSYKTVVMTTSSPISKQNVQERA